MNKYLPDVISNFKIPCMKQAFLVIIFIFQLTNKMNLGLMGLSNWDLQQYASKTNVMNHHKEIVPAKKRMMMAMKVFGL